MPDTKEDVIEKWSQGIEIARHEDDFGTTRIVYTDETGFSILRVFALGDSWQPSLDLMSESAGRMAQTLLEYETP